MRVKNKKFSTIWIDNREVKIIDQTKLPFEFKVQKLKSLNDFCTAISDMKVRGAPLIGVTAALGFAKSIEQNSSTLNIKKCYQKLLKTRPTAINLKWALDTIKKKLLKTIPSKRASLAFKLANLIRDDDIENCKQIGINGLKIIEQIYKKKKTSKYIDTLQRWLVSNC